MPESVEFSKKLVLLNAVSSVATRLLSISVLIWLQQYLLKRIAPEEYILIPVLYSIMMVAPILTTVLTSGLGRYIVEAYARGDDKRVTQIVSTMLPLLCMAGFVFLMCGWAFSWYVDFFLKIVPERIWDARIMVALLVFSATIRLSAAPFMVGFFVRQKFVYLNLINVFTEFFRIALLFILLYAVSVRVLWVIVAGVSAELLNFLIICAISVRLVPSLRFKVSSVFPPITKQIIQFGIWSFVLAVANTVRMALDPILLNRFASPVEVTTFYVGAIPFNQTQGLINKVREIISPTMIAMYANNEMLRLRNFYLRGGRQVLWAGMFVVAPILVYADTILSLYLSGAYSDASVVMRLQLLVIAIAYGNALFLHLAEASGNMKAFAWRFGVINLFNLGLTVLFVVFLGFGAIGSALATALSFAIFYPLLMWPAGRKMAGVSLTQWLGETLVPGLLPAVCSGGGMYVLRLVFHPESWISLFLCCSLGGVIYGGVLYFAAAKQQDRDDFFNFWEAVISRWPVLLRKG